MKIRNGFVSNSSSSSFVIRMEDISDAQRNLILGSDLSEGITGWYIKEEYGFILGHTTSHQFDMEHYLQSIAVNNVLWAMT